MDIGADVVSLTRKLVNFDTINPPGREQECVDFLATLLCASGFETSTFEFAPSRPTLIARLKGSSCRLPLCYAGHIDTVPLGDAQWTKKPFDGEIEGDKLYGRGTSDMKGGIAACVVSAIEMAGHPNRAADILLVVTAGEETGCEGSAHVASISGALGRAGALVIAEPTSNKPFIGHKGALWLELQARGVAAHGSIPDKGVNAIYPAAEAVLQLKHYRLPYSQHPLLGSATLNVGRMIAGTKVNIVPDRALVEVDIRTVPGTAAQDTVKELQTMLGDDIEIKTLLDLDAVATAPDNPWVQEVSAVVSKCTKRTVRAAEALPYFTDAATLTPAFGFVPTIILGPGEAEMSHKTDEYCYVPKLSEAVQIYTEISRNWCTV